MNTAIIAACALSWRGLLAVGFAPGVLCALGLSIAAILLVRLGATAGRSYFPTDVLVLFPPLQQVPVFSVAERSSAERGLQYTYRANHNCSSPVGRVHPEGNRPGGCLNYNR